MCVWDETSLSDWYPEVGFSTLKSGLAVTRERAESSIVVLIIVCIISCLKLSF